MSEIKQWIAVNSETDETRVAVLEDGILAELYLERLSDERIGGNIYRGRVENVLPGMQAAFVDIGLEKNAFLYVADALPKELGDLDEASMEVLGRMSIKDILKTGQEIIVQVTKEPLGTKGPRVVRNITIPGRNVVLMPTVDYVGVSRRIEDERERERLRSLAARIKPEGMGLIVRTVAEGKSERELEQDVEFLKKVWKKIQAKAKKGSVPSVLYRDYDLIYRIVRDLISADTDTVVIDKREDYQKAVDLLKMLSPDLVGRVRLYEGREPIFEHHNIETQIDRAVKRKLWLDCGGYIVVDQTEALTSIDVNTGKFTGSVNLEDTVLKTNIQAAHEIGRQLRLRNIGGIIVIDFIDMESEEDKRKVLAALDESLKRDKTKSNILGFTALGLVEMTRKKTKRTLEDLLQKSCPYCDGKGKVYSEATIAQKVKREIRKLGTLRGHEAMLFAVHPSVASVLIGVGGSNLSRLEEELSKSLYIKGCESLHIEECQLLSAGTRDEVEKMALPVRVGQILRVRVECPHVSNPSDGIARVEGFVLDIDGGGALVGQEADVEVTRLYRTYAKAKVVLPILTIEAAGC